MASATCPKPCSSVSNINDSPKPSSSVSFSNDHTTSQTQSAASSDVFLSFRGEDTRYNFISHLYSALDCHGIGAYMDNPDLVTGEAGASLIAAIAKSKIYIIVFSDNYASSSQCLDELVQIYKFHEAKKRLIISVYYKIDPSIVRQQSGSYRKALKMHQTGFKTWILKNVSKEHRLHSTVQKEKVANWRSALTEVAGFTEKPILRSEIDIIDQVVERILQEIQPKNMNVAKYPVGLESHVENIIALMSRHAQAEAVSSIGIYGMVGIGKTTHVKAVYNQTYHRFQGSCFLENVRENSKTETGLVRLQQQLINDVLKRKNIIIDNIDQGIELLRAKISSIKVLIVMDDLDDLKPMEFLNGIFAQGSIIFITTRNEDLLDIIKVEAKYKVKELGDRESLRLFTKHAFQDNIMSDTFTKLSEEIIECAGGLPLALEVFGSMLHNKSEEEWILFSDKLKRGPIDDVNKTLMTSFDTLKSVYPILSDVFLDIACFFIGWKKEEVVNILDTYYMFSNHNIDILRKNCLLTISGEDKLEMHHMLSQMGRKIAENDYVHEPEKHSRLWASEDIRNLFNKQKGTEAIKGIIPSNLNDLEALEVVSVNMETFKSMSKLRFLHLKNIYPTGSFEHIFEELRWLRWDSCPLECLPSEFHPQKLVTLALPRSKMRVMWEPNKVLKNLKTLNMKHSLELTTTPNFTKLPCLESLNFENCISLEKVHISIGTLERLVFLNLSGCAKLINLPNSICDLRALTSLNIGGCSSLTALPSELGNIESLRELNAWGLTVQKLPDSVRRLSKPFDLNLSDNEYLATPTSSASYLAPPGWDVYIGMRGKDTRLTFTSHLYSALNRHGVRAFLDEPALRMGEYIPVPLFEAIKESQTYVVVLSENYASSTWCLDELVHILNCRKTTGRLLIPVFYNIEPIHVRDQTGRFKQDFQKHETRFFGERVRTWRLALREVAELSGYHISKHRSESEVLDEIVDRIIFSVKHAQNV